MPYITPWARAELADGERGPQSAGEFNYLLTKLCLSYLGEMGRHNYAALNEVIGALECAKLELYRRVAAPYEDQKKEENGDVY